MNRQTKASAQKGKTIKAYGWIMNWKSIKSVDYKKIGEEYTIKTIFKRKVGSEELPIYIGNILTRSVDVIEERRFAKTIPIPVFISGIKSGERVYYNDYLGNTPEELLIEMTTRIIYVFLRARGLQLKIIDEIPPEMLAKGGVAPPKMTFKQFSQARSRAIAQLARKE